jgi:sigma-B regulation protein RsbU (phosphoserine phosphatase)
MATAWDNVLRNQLLDRRERLAAAIGFREGSERLAALLHEVDTALERFDDGTFGVCANCKGTIEADRLMADPLVCTCLDCLSVQQKRALEDDLGLAARIQSGLLPKEAKYDGWAVSFRYQPAGPVSGDYCDLLADQSGAGLMFLVGDVSGKGVAASLLMSQLHAIFRTLSPFATAVEELVHRANRIFCESTLSTHYATLVCGRAGPSGDVILCNAGHCPPLVVGKRGCVPVEPTGLPLGLFCETAYSCHRIHLEPGETVAIYTDGLTEAEDGQEHEYGMERFQQVLQQGAGAPPSELVDACIDDVRKFRGPAAQRDDLTLLLVRRQQVLQ